MRGGKDNEQDVIQSVYELLFPGNPDTDLEIKDLRAKFAEKNDATLFNLSEPLALFYDDVGNTVKHLIVAPINLIVNEFQSDFKQSTDKSKYTMYMAVAQSP